MKPQLAELNYTDTSRLIEAFEEWIAEGHTGSYNLRLLRKLERNKRILYEMPDEEENDATMQDGDQ